MTLHSSLALIELIGMEDSGGEPVSPAELHGTVTANLVAPRAMTTSQLAALIINPDESGIGACEGTVSSDKISGLDRIHRAIELEILSEEPFELPFNTPAESESDQANALEWAIGFINRHLVDWHEWIDQDEEQVAELLFPIVALGGMLEELPLESLDENPELLSDLSGAMGDAVVDLYLHFHAGEED